MMDKVYTQYRAGEWKLLPAIAQDNPEDDARCLQPAWISL